MHLRNCCMALRRSPPHHHSRRAVERSLSAVPILARGRVSHELARSSTIAFCPEPRCNGGAMLRNLRMGRRFLVLVTAVALGAPVAAGAGVLRDWMTFYAPGGAVSIQLPPTWEAVVPSGSRHM